MPTPNLHLSRKQRRSRPANLALLNRQRAVSPKDEPLRDKILNLYRSQPTQALTVANVMEILNIPEANARYHIGRLKLAGALEPRPKHSYIASATYKTPQEISAIVDAKIKSEPPRVVNGAPWSHGAQQNAINVAPHYGHFQQWIASIQDRMTPPHFSPHDREAIDELLKLALPTLVK
jgi:hypothetical protein